MTPPPIPSEFFGVFPLDWTRSRMLGSVRAKNLKLVGREIIFEVFQLMSAASSLTVRQMDRQTDGSHTLA